ncbi:MAG TPA: hypothetical protein VMW94_06385 [Actinomycetes bacterium]|nr:hypothetical protein [Actinomycetes bacterium]
MKATAGRAAIAVALGVAVLGGGGPAWGASGSKTSFTVDTQFLDAPSEIVAATGPLAACTAVESLSNEVAQTSPNRLEFSGQKVLICGEGQVLISYAARFNMPSGYRTFGTWTIVESTLPGVTTGGGTLKGDNRDCTLLPDSGGCILDEFVGTVS